MEGDAAAKSSMPVQSEPAQQTPAQQVRLRPVTTSDLTWMFECQQDPESNAMAVTYPRGAENFFSHWFGAIADPGVVARLVLINEQPAGWISRYPLLGQHGVGYWLAKAFWGGGFATEAVRQLLLEDSARPMIATVATSNIASLRVLQKNGFVIQHQEWSPECERFPASEIYVLILQ